jgi:hypothetical protein
MIADDMGVLDADHASPRSWRSSDNADVKQSFRVAPDRVVLFADSRTATNLMTSMPSTIGAGHPLELHPPPMQ